MVRPPFPMLDRCAVGCVINVVVAAAVVADFVDAVAAGIDFADAMIPINETRTLVHSPITPFSGVANPGLLHSPSHKTNLHSPSHYFITSFSIIIYSQSQLIYIDHLVGPHKLLQLSLPSLLMA